MVARTLDFATQNDATPYNYEMQPAQVNIDIAHAPTGRGVEVWAGNGSIGYAETYALPDAGASVVSVLPMTNFDDVVANYYGPTGYTAETEWLGTPVSVSAGATATATVNLDWDDAQYAYLAGPTCRHSGKPGTTVKLVLKGWRAGEKAGFVGYYRASQYLYPQSQTSSGAGDTYTVPLEIRAKAPVGHYEIRTFRADDPDSLLDFFDVFQVCSFKASASAIHHGTAIRLSGKVPGYGYVTIYSTRHKVSAQPWTLAAKGWVKGARYRISSSGKFLTGPLHPRRTTTYVAKYTGFHFPAFTPIVKVTVR